MATVLLSEVVGQTTWTAGSGENFQWSSAANWSAAAEPTIDDHVVLPAPIPNPGALLSPEGILLGVGTLAKSLTVSAGYVLRGGDLTLSEGNIAVASGQFATIGSAIKGNANLTKSGSGILMLTGANTYSGTTIVSNGTLTIDGDHSGATGGFALNNISTFTRLVLNSSAKINVAPDSSVSASIANTATFPVNLGSSANVNNAGSLLLGRGAVLTVNGGTWAQSGNISVGGLLASHGAIEVVDGGTFTYTGANAIIGYDGTAASSITITSIFGAHFQGTGTVLVGRGVVNNSNNNVAGEIVVGTGGTLITQQKFALNVEDGRIVIGYGKIKLSADLPDFSDNLPIIISSPVAPAFDTNGFSTTIDDSISSTNAGGFRKEGAGTLTLSGVNSYAGVTSVTAGTLNINGNQSGATGGWWITSSTVNFNSGSSVAVESGKSIKLANGSVESLNVDGTVINAGLLEAQAGSTLNIRQGGNWTQGGSMQIQALNNSRNVRVNVDAGGTFTYTGSTPINLSGSSADPGVALSGTGSLNIAGGIFTTGKNFHNSSVNSGTSTSANLTLSGGGAIKLSADIPSLVTTTGFTPTNIQVGTGGGIIDTNGFSTVLGLGVSNMSGQTGAFTKNGPGTLELSGANSYTGNTTVSGGTLLVTGALSGTTRVNVTSGSRFVLGASNLLNNGAVLNLEGGTFATSGFDEVANSLSLGAGHSTINLGSGSSILIFASSTSISWAGALSILNWDGILTGGGTDQLYFGTTAAGLTPTQVEAIDFVNPAGLPAGIYDALMLPTGELVAVPEPGSALLLLGGIGSVVAIRRRRPDAFGRR